jgi:hypothetical protein
MDALWTMMAPDAAPEQPPLAAEGRIRRRRRERKLG